MFEVNVRTGRKFEDCLNEPIEEFDDDVQEFEKQKQILRRIDNENA